MVNHKNSRQKGFFFIGLKTLDHIKFEERDYDAHKIFKCKICNKDVKKSKLKVHFQTHHTEVYDMLTSLMQSWGLVSDVNIEIENKRYYCECGKSYASYAGLYRHRKNHIKTNNEIIV